MIIKNPRNAHGPLLPGLHVAEDPFGMGDEVRTVRQAVVAERAGAVLLVDAGDETAVEGFGGGVQGASRRARTNGGRWGIPLTVRI